MRLTEQLVVIALVIVCRPTSPAYVGAGRVDLNLKTQFNSDDIYSAMLHAARYASYDAKAVERILAVKAQPRTLESIRNEKARQQLAETLPEIKQRPLHEYSELFQTQETNHENTTNAGHDQRPSADSEAEENTGKARQ